jgi:hypothetical protein
MSWSLSVEYSNVTYNHSFFYLQLTSVNLGYVLVNKYSSPNTYIYIYKTTNAGLNWFTSNSLPGLNYTSMKFYNDTVGSMICWDYQTNRDFILYSKTVLLPGKLI